MMNLNKQSKLFSQGMAPVFLSPGRTQWERLRDPPTYETVDSNFQMSFKFRVPEDPSGITYFAFTYPYTYKELQASLDRLHRRLGNGGKSYSELVSLREGAIYFHRENVIRSLEKRKIDLLTITGMNGIQNKKESSLTNLFQEEDDNRPFKFAGKKTVFISARVHPGETCSSYSMNGFIKFILKEADVRACMLRKKYVFKLIPMLNPDGVVNGHYRTDTRGVNLNRVYSNPSVQLNPTIYAARKLILYAHLDRDIDDNHPTSPPSHLSQSDPTSPVGKHATSPSSKPVSSPCLSLDPKPHDEVAVDRLGLSKEPPSAVSGASWEVPLSSRSSLHRVGSFRTSSASLSSYSAYSPYKSEFGSHWYEMTENSRCSEGDESISDFSLCLASKNPQIEESHDFDFVSPGCVSAKASGGTRTNFLGAFIKSSSHSGSSTSASDSLSSHNQVHSPPKTPRKSSLSTDEELNEVTRLSTRPMYPTITGESGLFMYIDIHGHASKRGIFMYGNHFENTETKIDALLFPKLMSINSANFDFPACNFTQRNMFLKDRHTGAGREGSGRVSVYRATGIPYCYTLECNFNTGRFTNNIPMASRDLGRASPPPTYDVPPKYNPAIYEETGKCLGVSILDLTESNPWTRLTCSSSKTLKGVRTWIRNYLKNAETEMAGKTRSVKSSPVRTRLRNLTAVKKSTVKQLKLTSKSPRSPESPRPMVKFSRKVLTTKNSQSTSGKLVRQASTSSASEPTKPGESVAISSVKRPRTGSVKRKKLKRPGAKPIVGHKSSLKSGSRPSSPRRTANATADAKAVKVAPPPPPALLAKGSNVLSKRGSTKLQEPTSTTSCSPSCTQGPATPSRAKKTKKKKNISL